MSNTSNAQASALLFFTQITGQRTGARPNGNTHNAMLKSGLIARRSDAPDCTFWKRAAQLDFKNQWYDLTLEGIKAFVAASKISPMALT